MIREVTGPRLYRVAGLLQVLKRRENVFSPMEISSSTPPSNPNTQGISVKRKWKKMQQTTDVEKLCEMLPSGHDTAVKSQTQQLWLPICHLNRVKPAKIPA